MDSKKSQNLEPHRKTVNLIITLEIVFQEHHALVKAEEIAQQNKLKTLSKLTDRYLQLGTDESPFNDSDESFIEEIIVTQYFKNVQLLRASLARVGASLKNIEKYCEQFEAATATLDMDAKSVSMEGIIILEPISFFVRLLTDLYEHFYVCYLKWQYCLTQMEPEYLGPLEAFKAVIKSSDEYEGHFCMSLSNIRSKLRMHIKLPVIL